MTVTTPAAAWQALSEGNRRFVNDDPKHPSQGIARRAALAGGQQPKVVLFGCGDSRVAAEIIFDQGLGDMFVVRTAGHTVDSAVLGSIEYALEVLDVPLIAVLGHDSCGAVKAAIELLDGGSVPPGFVRDIVERVAPSILEARRNGFTNVDDLEAQHVKGTGKLLFERSRIIAERIRSGRCAIVGLTYKLTDGQVHMRGSLGYIGEGSSGLDLVADDVADPEQH